MANSIRDTPICRNRSPCVRKLFSHFSVFSTSAVTITLGILPPFPIAILARGAEPEPVTSCTKRDPLPLKFCEGCGHCRGMCCAMLAIVVLMFGAESGHGRLGLRPPVGAGEALRRIQAAALPRCRRKPQRRPRDAPSATTH